MQTITWEKKKVVIVVYICHVSLLENHDLRCCIEKRDILQTSTFREMCRELGFVTQILELNLSQLSCFFSSVVMLTSRGTQISLVRDLIATIFRLIFFLVVFFPTNLFFRLVNTTVIDFVF